MTNDDALVRAARLSLLPGMSLAAAAKRTGLSARAIGKARKGVAIDRDDLVLAALSENGTRSEGAIGELAALAGWLDAVNHDGSTAAGVERDLLRLAQAGRIALDGATFRLLRPFP